MKSKYLQYFMGKVCTIFTVPINRDYSTENPKTYPQQLVMYFTGIVEGVDDFGILLRNMKGDLKSFFAFDKIVGIAEEKVLDPENAEDKMVIESLKPIVQKEMAKESITPPTKSGPLVDPQGLNNLMKQLKTEPH